MICHWRVVILSIAGAGFLAGCSHTPLRPADHSPLDDQLMVVTRLADQLQMWQGAPYRYGGMSKRGVDCSGFVMLTFQQQFNLLLPRETYQQAQTGRRISRDDLRPGDLVFFKTGSGENGLHVGIYNGNHQFIHASASQGVIRSSLNNRYWRLHFWQARRI